MVGGAPLNTTPTSPKARVTERLTMTGPNTQMHELTYDDPETYIKPWTTRIEWVRDDGYQFYEYACHEGNLAMRNYIIASRAERAAIARGDKVAESKEKDSRTRFLQAFDVDPGIARPPAAAGAAAAPARAGRGGAGG
jgi:hypothetical protein